MPPLLAPVPRRYVLVTPARIFKLQPFRNVKRDFCRTPSIGFNGHRYSNLFDGGSSSFNPSLPALLLYSYLLSLSLSRSLQPSRFSPRRKPLHVTGASYRGLARARGKKNLHLARFFFSFGRRYSWFGSGTEAASTDARIRTWQLFVVDISGGVSFAGRSRSREKSRCRVTRSFEANKSPKADTMAAPIFETRYGNYGDLIGRLDDWPSS